MEDSVAELGRQKKDQKLENRAIEITLSEDQKEKMKKNEE